MHYYRDSFVKLPGEKDDYFAYQDYIDMMMPQVVSAAAKAEALLPPEPDRLDSLVRGLGTSKRLNLG